MLPLYRTSSLGVVGRSFVAAVAFQAALQICSGEFWSPVATGSVMHRYERRLPHWDVVGHPLFVTFRLYGSLPKNRVFPPAQLATSGEAFRVMDRILDSGASGPLLLRLPEIARLVECALRDGESRLHRYEMHAFVVMPNHVHLLVTPMVVASGWLGPLKGFTSYQANKMMGTTGQPFWQEESYDHLVRSDVEFERIRRYIEQNPVNAGLVATAEQFRWSSAA
jgi:REP element-mobilizing transposase RayT